MNVSQSELENFLNDSGLSREDLSQDDLRRAQAYLLGVPYIDLKDHTFELSILSLIPEPVARMHNVIAFGRVDDRVLVALLDLETIRALKFVPFKIRPHLTTDDSLKRALLFYQRALRDEFGSFIQDGAEGLVRHAEMQGATHVHLEPQENDYLVRYRIGGRLHDAMVLPHHVASKIKETIHTSRVPVVHGEKMVFRIHPKGVSGFTLEALGFHGRDLEILHEALALPHGLILVCGPKHSGKRTTLYTMLDILNSPSTNIGTIEDPIEYHLPRVNQTQVNKKTGYTFEKGLRSVLHQDADVIMISDLKGKEVANLALNAAYTGRLVLAGVNSSSSLEASLVVNQRLVRKLWKDKKKYFLNKEELISLSNVASLEKMLGILKEYKVVGEKDGWDKVPFYKGSFLEEDYILIHEVLTPGASPETSLIEDGILKAVQGLTTLEEVLKV